MGGPPWHELPPGYNLPQYHGQYFWPRAPEKDAVAMLMRNTSFMAHLKLSEMRGGVAKFLGCHFQWVHSICLTATFVPRARGHVESTRPPRVKQKALAEALRAAG